VARPKSDDKREAILAAATRVFAESGLAAPTSAISKAAGIAEGTLFTYFRTKDDLINELYREIKLELAKAIVSGLSRKKDFRGRLQYFWNSYVNWGVAYPDRRKALAQLRVSDRLTQETKTAGQASFGEFEGLARQAMADGVLRDCPLEFLSAAIGALAEMTMELMAANPRGAAKYRSQGFALLWSGIGA
jgi:AcrR family transcriptional regulator